MDKFILYRIFDSFARMTIAGKDFWGDKSLKVMGVRQCTHEFLAEKAREEMKDKNVKKFKTAKEAIDYLHNL